MQRWGIATPFTDGDRGWQGIDMTRDRGLVSQGLLSLGQNTRLRTGTARQRSGTAIPSDYNPVNGFNNAILSSGVFRDPNGNESMLIAPKDTQYVWALRDGKDPVQILYNAAETASGRTNGEGLGSEFVQAFDKVTFHRRPNPAGGRQLVWNGNYDQSADANKWTPVTLSPTGLTLVPPYYNGEPFQRRVVYYNTFYPVIPGRDEFVVTDIEDYTSYDPVYQFIRVNSAESDFITRILSYFQSSIVVFKNQSIHMLSDLGTYPFAMQQRQLSRSLGACGCHIPIMVGADVLFLSQPLGFYRLSEIIENQIATLPVPISEPIQSVIDQINWGYTAIYGCSATLDNYAFFGVALGSSATALNSVLVYNTQSRMWESAGDTWNSAGDFRFNALHVTNYNGVHRVFAVDYVNAIVYLLYEGLRDELRNGSFSVPFKLETRGYTGDDSLGFKKFNRLRVSVGTYDPDGVLTGVMDGFNEEFPLGTIDKNRLDYYTHGRGPFNFGTDDPTAPFREDYSTEAVDNFAGEDFEGLPEGPIFSIPPTGPFAVLGDEQQTVETYWVRQNGRWMSVRVENNDGALDLRGITVEGTSIANTVRTLA